MESIKNILLHVRNHRLFLIIAIPISFFIGYELFYLILKIELNVIKSTGLNSTSPFYYSLLPPTIEQVVLGLVALMIFMVSQKYYLLIFIYLGFLIQYANFLYYYKSLYSSGTYIFPVFIYALTGIIVIAGFKYGKKLGLLAVLISILFLTIYNYSILTTNLGTYINSFFDNVSKIL